jgi:hypothetical protein
VSFITTGRARSLSSSEGWSPNFLCAGSEFQHAGTTDIDVQVNLEIACGSVNTERLERALRKAEFEPETNHWRWSAPGPERRTVVKFELLADLDDAPAETTVLFDGCEKLEAVNLRGTGFATRDVEVRELSARVGEDERTVEVNVTGLAGFLMAKCAAARSRRARKDWYDIAFVLAHNEAGGPRRAAEAVIACFGDERATLRSAMDDLLANFAEPNAQGPRAYAEQMRVDHPELDNTVLRADAVVSVRTFHAVLFS